MYQEVLEKEIPKCKLDYESINNAIGDIRKTYKRISIRSPLPAIDYNDVEYRYAYVYLYSVCHTAVTEHCALLLKESAAFENMMKYDQRKLRICSLGGGPGCDIFGLLSARLKNQGIIGCTSNFHLCVVDLCKGWENTLRHAVRAFVNDEPVYQRKLEWYFIQENLCGSLSLFVIDEIEQCDILNVVKFISVVSNYYNNFPEILRDIFCLLKPGACVFYLDNSKGGFYEIVSNAAEKAGLKPTASPKAYRWSLMSNYLTNSHFIAEPLPSMSVCFALWEKPVQDPVLCSIL